jgi:huntingtin-interacting protein 1-related protein
VDTSEIRDTTGDIKKDTSQILEEIDKLKEQLAETSLQDDGRAFMLQRFLENSTDYAATVIGPEDSVPNTTDYAATAIGPEDSVPDSEFNHTPDRNEYQQYVKSLRNRHSTQAARQIDSDSDLVYSRSADNHELEYVSQRHYLPTNSRSPQQLGDPIYERLATLQNENMLARAQYAKDQNMLEQYDQRVKLFETELARLMSDSQQQLPSESDEITSLQEQLNTWRAKYESLAKLYSQLRHEHLNVLVKFKGLQQELVSTREKNDELTALLKRRK